MVQVIRRGYDAGAEAGENLGSAIEQLFSRKIQQMEERHKEREAQRRWANAGYTDPRQATLLEFLRESKDPNIYEAMQRFAPQQNISSGGQQTGNQDQLSNMMAQLGTGQQQVPQQQGQIPQQILQQPMAPQQQIMQPQQQGNTIFGPGMSRKDQEMLLKQQATILKMNKPFLDTVEKTYEDDFFIARTAKRALKELDKHKARSGLMGYLPIRTANESTQILDKYYNDIVGRLSSKDKGPLTAARIKLAQSRKPEITMPIGAQRRMLQEIIKDAETGGIAMNKIVNGLVESNNNLLPQGIKNLAQKIHNQRYPKLFEDEEEEISNNIKTPAHLAPENEQETGLGGLIRQGVSTAAKIGGDVVTSLPGLASAGMGLANYVGKSLGTEKVPTYEKLQEWFPSLKYVKTPEQMADKIDELTGGYTKPRSEGEKSFQETFRVVGSLLAPSRAVGYASKGLKLMGYGEKAVEKGIKASKYLLPFSGVQLSVPQALIMTAAGKAAGGVANAFGAGPAGQTISQVVAMTLAGNATTRRGIEKKMAQSFEEAKRRYDLSVQNTSGFVEDWKGLQHKVDSSGITHPEVWEDVSKQVDTALSKPMHKGHMLVNDLIDLRQNINARFKWAPKQREKGIKEYTPEEIKKPLHDLIAIIDKPIAEAGLKNPEAGASFMLGQDLSRGLRYENAATKWFSRNAFKSGEYKSKMVSSLFTTAATAGSLIGLKQLSQWSSLLKHSKQARILYKEAMKSAAMGSTNAASQALSQLDRIALQEEQEK